jgi:AraC-like DNA-binding protein
LKEYKENNDLQSIAYKYDYYDYSHFTKEFSAFSGFSPKTFKTTEKSITENLVIQENADFLHKKNVK